MMQRTIAVLTFCAALGATQAAGAQAGTLLSIQGSGLYQVLSGDAYEGAGTGGIGVEGQLRFNRGPLLGNGRSLGVGVQYSLHTFDEAYNTEDLNLLGVFVEPRIILNLNATRMAPYASARVAFLRQSARVEGTDVSATGVQLNAGGGIIIVVTDRANLDVGATVGAVQFGEYSTGSKAGSGLNVVMRVGLILALGR
jgi:hypothetical protein